MSKKISLRRAIRTGLIKQCSLINPEALLPKDKREVILYGKDTGARKIQKFQREHLKWAYVDLDGTPAIISSTTTAMLSLRGRRGYKLGINAIEEICELNSNWDIDMEARAIYQDDIDEMGVYFTYISKNMQAKDAWTAIQFVSGSKCGLYHVDHDDVWQNILYDRYSTKKNFQASFGIRFIIELPLNNIFVDTESYNKNGAWELILKN